MTEWILGTAILAFVAGHWFLTKPRRKGKG